MTTSEFEPKPEAGAENAAAEDDVSKPETPSPETKPKKEDEEDEKKKKKDKKKDPKEDLFWLIYRLVSEIFKPKEDQNQQLINDSLKQLNDQLNKKEPNSPTPGNEANPTQPSNEGGAPDAGQKEQELTKFVIKSPDGEQTFFADKESMKEQFRDTVSKDEFFEEGLDNPEDFPGYKLEDKGESVTLNFENEDDAQSFVNENRNNLHESPEPQAASQPEEAAEAEPESAQAPTSETTSTPSPQ